MTISTDHQDELLTQVDSKNNVIGKISRKKAHSNPSIFYRAIFVLVKDKSDKILVQKRSSTKDLYPNCWDLSVGGHVVYGKSYIETALKELEEELGIGAAERELQFIGEVLVRLPKSNEFFHVFEYSLKSGDTITLREEEISEINWMSINEIKDSIEKNSLTWYPRPIQVMNALISL